MLDKVYLMDIKFYHIRLTNLTYKFTYVFLMIFLYCPYNSCIDPGVASYYS